MESGEDYQVIPSAQLTLSVDAEIDILEQAKSKASEE